MGHFWNAVETNRSAYVKDAAAPLSKMGKRNERGNASVVKHAIELPEFGDRLCNDCVSSGGGRDGLRASYGASSQVAYLPGYRFRRRVIGAAAIETATEIVYNNACAALYQRSGVSRPHSTGCASNNNDPTSKIEHEETSLG
jgi:hypothetical protein